MSIELLIILAVIAFSLIQQYLQAPRQRDQGPPPQAERQAEPATLPGAPSPAPPDRVPPSRFMFDPATLIPEPARTPTAGRPTVPAVIVLSRRRRFAQLRDTAELRRAIVLMTILEPCRAMDPQILSKRP